MKGKMMVILAAAVASLTVAGIGLGAGGDQGRRLSGPFCVDLSDGTVHAVPRGFKCAANQIAKPGVAVSGPAGPAGANGAVGPQGNSGGTGATGSDGARGANGQSVTLTPIYQQDGEEEIAYPCEGASAYDGQVGVTLTVGDESLNVCNGRPGRNGYKGDKGDKGDQGDQGDQGEDGQQGEQGEDGQPGHDGSNGEDGKPGADGQNGHDGEDGEDGHDGHDGEDGHDGGDSDS